MLAPVPPDLLQWAAEHGAVGTPRGVAGTSCSVWRIGSCWLKVHRGPRGASQEAEALGGWAHRVGVRAPALIARRGAALLLGHVEGVPVDALDPAARRSALAAAGAFARRLHELPVPQDDPLPLPEALARRYADARPPAFPPWTAVAPIARVPTHRDLHPRNLLWDGSLGVLDWEHARLDHPAMDAVRLVLDPDWPAFVDGLGGAPSDLAAVVLLHAAGCERWAARHADARWGVEARALLAWLAAQPHRPSGA